MSEKFRVDIKFIGMVIAVSSAIVTPLIALGSYKSRVEAVEKVSASNDATHTRLWSSLSEVKDMTNKHDAVMPIIQADLNELKNDVNEIQRDIKGILKAVSR